MDDVKITFFMIVTDPDLVIADYAVRSYAKIEDRRFTLRIYSNLGQLFSQETVLSALDKVSFCRNCRT